MACLGRSTSLPGVSRIAHSKLGWLNVARQFCNSVKTVTSPESLFNGYSVKIMLYKSLSSMLYCIRLLGENIAEQSYRVSQNLTTWTTIRTLLIHNGLHGTNIHGATFAIIMSRTQNYFKIANKQLLLLLFACNNRPLKMKGCIFHFVKWQRHPFISKGAVYCPLQTCRAYLEGSSPQRTIEVIR